MNTKIYEPQYFVPNFGRTTIIFTILLAKVQKLQTVTFQPFFDLFFAKFFSNCNYLLTENPFLPIMYILYIIVLPLQRIIFMGQPTTKVNRLQYSRLARYSLRDTPYCAQSLLFAVSATGSAHKRSPSLFANANRDDNYRITFTHSIKMQRLFHKLFVAFSFYILYNKLSIL